MLLIALIIKFSSSGPIIFWSKRVGMDNKIFLMPKFRSMRVNTPSLATHLLENPVSYLTPIGAFLRQYSLDELPQLLSVLKGDMSLVGPRPALYNQYDLINIRTKKGVHKILPGITGWAQINGRDDLAILNKAHLDEEYLKLKSFWFDLKILWKTFYKALFRENVSH